jgi:hypothetical protein
MKAKRLVFGIVLMIILCPGLLLARTQPASMGRSLIVTTAFSVSSSAAGGIVNENPSDDHYWSMPLLFDTSGNKNICVSAYKTYSTDRLDCYFQSWSQTGTSLSNRTFSSFASGASTRCINNVNIVAGSINSVVCRIESNRQVIVYGLDYQF